MKKMTNEKLAAVNGGWKYPQDKYLPVRSWRPGYIYLYSGSYKTIGGKVAYSVYSTPYGWTIRTA